MQELQEQGEALAGVDGPGWHRGGETEVWRGGHVVRLGRWALFRHEVDGTQLELVALVEAGEDGWTWEPALVDWYRCGARSMLAAMAAVETALAGNVRGRDQRRADMLLRRWCAGAAQATAA